MPRILNRIPARAPNDRFLRDTQPFCEARFSCREPRRFVGIALDWTTAAQMARKVAHQANHFWARLNRPAETMMITMKGIAAQRIAVRHCRSSRLPSIAQHDASRLTMRCSPARLR